jgi:hypothetical protein
VLLQMPMQSNKSSSNPESYSTTSSSSDGHRPSNLPQVARPRPRRGSDSAAGPFQRTLSTSDVSESYGDSVTVRLPGILGTSESMNRSSDVGGGSASPFPPPSLSQMGGLEPQQEGDSESDSREVLVPLPASSRAGGQRTAARAAPATNIWFRMFGKRNSGTGSSSDIGRAAELPPPVEEETEHAAGQEGGGAGPASEGGPLLSAATPRSRNQQE